MFAYRTRRLARCILTSLMLDFRKRAAKSQTVLKYFIKHYGAQISFYFMTGNLSP